MELFKVRFISELYEEIASFWSESTEFVLRTGFFMINVESYWRLEGTGGRSYHILFID